MPVETGDIQDLEASCNLGASRNLEASRDLEAGCDLEAGWDLEAISSCNASCDWGNS